MELEVVYPNSGERRFAYPPPIEPDVDISPYTYRKVNDTDRLPKLHTLTGHANFRQWYYEVRRYIRALGWGILVSHRISPPVDGPTYSKWSKTNEALSNWLMDSMSPEVRYIIECDGVAYPTEVPLILTLLRVLFDPEICNSAYVCEQALANFKRSDCDGIGMYVDELVRLLSRTMVVSTPMSLSRAMAHLIAAIRGDMPDWAKTLNDILEALTIENINFGAVRIWFELTKRRATRLEYRTSNHALRVEELGDQADKEDYADALEAAYPEGDDYEYYSDTNFFSSRPTRRPGLVLLTDHTKILKVNRPHYYSALSVGGSDPNDLTEAPQPEQPPSSLYDNDDIQVADTDDTKIAPESETSQSVRRDDNDEQGSDSNHLMKTPHPENPRSSLCENDDGEVADTDETKIEAQKSEESRSVRRDDNHEQGSDTDHSRKTPKSEERQDVPRDGDDDEVQSEYKSSRKSPKPKKQRSYQRGEDDEVSESDHSRKASISRKRQSVHRDDEGEEEERFDTDYSSEASKTKRQRSYDRGSPLL